MMLQNKSSEPIDSQFVSEYFLNLVKHFFQILPMREKQEESLPVYLDSLRDELAGCASFFQEIGGEATFISLLSILQSIIDNPEISVRKTKREVFKAISACNKLSSQYSNGGGV